jgi:NhaP-type Na+/H+ or K+/H+ antiporter
MRQSKAKYVITKIIIMAITFLLIYLCTFKWFTYEKFGVWCIGISIPLGLTIGYVGMWLHKYINKPKRRKK